MAAAAKACLSPRSTDSRWPRIPMARFLMDAGFHPGPLGMHLRRVPLPIAQAEPMGDEVQ